MDGHSTEKNGRRPLVKRDEAQEGAKDEQSKAAKDAEESIISEDDQLEKVRAFMSESGTRGLEVISLAECKNIGDAGI